MPDTTPGPQESGKATAAELDVIVVGAGLAGLYALHRLRGLGLRVRVYEAGSGVGADAGVRTPSATTATRSRGPKRFRRSSASPRVIVT